MTIRELELKFLKNIAPLDRELIFSHVLKKPREFVLIHPEFKLSAAQIRRISALIQRRINGEPLAYLTGHKEFFGLDFRVNQHTLIPRPETELLVEQALAELRNLLRNKLRNVSAIDVGTGSGNVIVSVAWHIQHGTWNIKQSTKDRIKLYGTDISAPALRIAKQNAINHRVNDGMELLNGDLLDPVAKKCSMIHACLPVDKAPCSMLITANLPYLDTGWKNLLTSSETRGLKFEPSSALYAGQDGLDEYRRLAAQIRKLHQQTECDITLFCEIGHRQKKEMANIFAFAGKIDFFKDLARHWRVAKIEL